MAVIPAPARRAALESLARRSARAQQIIVALRENYPEADCALTHHDVWQLLVATILSAQCTDERVNKVTPGLFRRFRSIKAFAQADLEEIQEAIRSTGFFRNKARSIQGAARAIIAHHKGRVPRDMDDLTSLPGVGRKTAHVVRGTFFGLPAITVDTHVGRLSRRLGLSRHTDPVKVEGDLEKILPEAERTYTSHALIWHGRRICAARRPTCETCNMASFCPSAGLF
jgi:endonuclease-3